MSKDVFAKLQEREDIEDVITFDPAGIPVRSTFKHSRTTKRIVDIAHEMLVRMELFFRKRMPNRELTELSLMTEENEILVYRDKEINLLLVRSLPEEIVISDEEPEVPHEYWDETSEDEWGNKKKKLFRKKFERKKKRDPYDDSDDFTREPEETQEDVKEAEKKTKEEEKKTKEEVKEEEEEEDKEKTKEEVKEAEEKTKEEVKEE